MGYKDREKQREYQRSWKAKRRSDWLSQNGPCTQCGSSEKLEVDHVDPNKKITNSIWSWTQTRRDAELTRCQVLCSECHRVKTRDQFRRISADDVRKIRSLYESKMFSQRQLAPMFGVSYGTIGKICRYEKWKDI